MRKTNILVLLMWLLAHYSFAQIDLPDTWDGSDGSHPQSPINPGTPTEVKIPIPPGKKSDTRERGSERDTPPTPLVGNYEGPSSEGSWGSNGLSSNKLYKRMGDGMWWEKDDTEAMSVLIEMKGLLSSDCIDIEYLQEIQARFNSLSPSQKSALGYDGEEAFNQLKERLNKARALYSQNITIAQNIKNNMFSSIDKDIMRLSYEELNGYLKQFLSKEEFDRAKIEYEKYEKAQIVNNVYEKIRIQELRKKNDNRKIETEKTNYHLPLQKVRRTWIDNYKVGAMAMKSISDGQKQLTSTYGETFIPKSELLEIFDNGINTVNKAIDIKGLFVKAFSGDWEGTYSDGKRIVKEMVFNPTKDMLSSSVTVLTNKWINLKNGIAAYNIHSFSTEGILNKSLLNVESFGDDNKFYNANKDLNNFLFKSIPEKTRDEIKRTY